ncbi:MAG: septum formation protein Maf [Candidatus Latescibacteria bacterium]|nr:septum formation protein Maf [Candidatus Latescibacterota bacterium]NIM22163.1 septum formation protein Maf [Candidatus Latescibacterota bacterium]NIM64713.1 septum formation protein Maf [Candidatus Latescibacterota bacterium]NIO01223.1 septum formation protein Maf [Candidatus Latescibacterota bacterium]NIO27608.1 septum formation protein Maf [Candidatus Latescibacterota bacterium]
MPEHAQQNLILASESPRRIELLKMLGFEFRVEPARINEADETIARDPFMLPQELARMKAEDVGSRFPDALVVGADTVVILDGRALTKPRDDHEAAEFLKALSGAVHTVVTGLAIKKAASAVLFSGKEETRVRFRELTKEEIDSYVASGEGRDKAGSYAVQGLGACLVRSIEGCHYNVVGMPIALLFELMNRAAGTGG